MIMTLVNGGAHLDFRTRQGGLTPLHRSAIHNRKEAIVVSSPAVLTLSHVLTLVYVVDSAGTRCIAECVR